MTDVAMRICKTCKQTKSAVWFSWSDKQHRYLDSRCKACKAADRRARRKPKNSQKPYTYYAYLKPNMYDDVPLDDIKFTATLIDGEGCITSSFPASTLRPLYVKITMIHKPTMEWLRNTFGGAFGAHRTRQGNARQSWWWQIGGIRSLALLRRALPFMRVKQEEAEIAIALGMSLWNVEHIRGRVPEEVLALRCALGQELHELKLREWPA